MAAFAVVALAVSAAEAAEAKRSFGTVPKQALVELKATVGKPFSSGLVFIDGNLVQMDVSYHGSLKKATFDENATVLSLPNDPSIDNGTQPQSSFAIDELKIWDYCKKDFSLGD